jgi:predicted metal-binding membrane protein
MTSRAVRQPHLWLAAVATAGAWAYTVRSAGSMGGAMPMPGGWSMSMAWMPMGGQVPAAHAAMFLVMWTVMMVAMMLPSAMPFVVLHSKLMDARRGRDERGAGSNALLLTGYFGTWAAFGAIAYIAGIAITSQAMRHVALSRAVPIASGLALIVAGAYQLTPLKQTCLAHCRSPLELFAHHPIRNRLDSLRFGIHHGAFCAACCWALMVMQLVVGVMSIPMMIAIALVILVEKTWAYGRYFAMGVGVASIAAGTFFIARAIGRA